MNAAAATTIIDADVTTTTTSTTSTTRAPAMKLAATDIGWDTPPFGLIFACFMVGCMLGSSLFGKAMGSGYAINAIIGKKNIMKKAENTFISSTFWGERIGYTAALSSFKEFKRLNAFKIVEMNGKMIKNFWSKLSKKYNVPIKVMGTSAIPSFEFVNNHSMNKTFVTQEMLKNKILATNMIYINIFHNKKNIKKYIKVLDNIFKDISKNNIKKNLKSKVCFKPINRIN